jgi:CheY-like chemotaxis protein
MTDGTGTALILVVDDNEMNRDMLSRRLERLNYEVIMADNGQRALELLQEQAFDLVLLDIMMPKMNGYEVLETIKRDPKLRHLPVIMISAVDDLDSVVKCIELGAEDYLFKPFNPVLLKARLSASLDKARSQSNAGLDPALPALLTAIQSEVDHLREMITTPEQHQSLGHISENTQKALRLLGQ